MHCSFPVSTSQQCVAAWNFRIGRTHEEKCIAPYSEIHVQQDVSPAAYIYVDRLCILGAVSKDMHLLARHLVKYVGMACPYTERDQTGITLICLSLAIKGIATIFAENLPAIPARIVSVKVNGAP